MSRCEDYQAFNSDPCTENFYTVPVHVTISSRYEAAFETKQDDPVADIYPLRISAQPMRVYMRVEYIMH